MIVDICKQSCVSLVVLTWDTISTSQPHVAAGRLRALAVSGEIGSNSARRFQAFRASDTPKWKKVIADTGARAD